MTSRSFPPARGDRRSYASLPLGFRLRIERRAGSRVLRAQSHPEGFSPGVAATLSLANGRRIFLKAVSSAVNRGAREIYRMEVRNASRLPRSVPAPRFLWSLEVDPWIALAFEEVRGRNPPLPWRTRDLERVLALLEQLAKVLTPSPLRGPSIASAHHRSFAHWRGLEQAKGGTRDLARLGPWVRRHLGELAEAEGRWEHASRGSTLLHCDFRADNLLLGPNGVFLVDWPWACRGAPWIDLLFFLPSVAMQGGPLPWTIFASHPVGARARGADVDAVLSALAGFFILNGREPPDPSLPTLRAFQWAQGHEALRWLRCRWEQGVDPGLPRDRRWTF